MLTCVQAPLALAKVSGNLGNIVRHKTKRMAEIS